MRFVLCIGGPLDGKTAPFTGYYHEHREQIAGNPGEMPMAKNISPEMMADPEFVRVATFKVYAYRCMEFIHPTSWISAERYVHESVTDEEALKRFKDEWDRD